MNYCKSKKGEHENNSRFFKKVISVLIITIIMFTTGCATLDMEKESGADTVNNTATVKSDNNIFSPDWSRENKTTVKIIYASGFALLGAGLTLSAQQNQGTAALLIPILAIMGLGTGYFASMDWEKDSNWYKIPVITGAFAGLTADIVMAVNTNDPYGTEKLFYFMVAPFFAMAGAGIGGIVGDILNAIESPTNAGKKPL